MAFLYTNFLDDNYYLHQGLTRKGNPRYWFSKKPDGTLVDRIPDGYRVHETPNGMVYLAKIRPPVFSRSEINAVKSSIPKKLDAKVNIMKNMITIYLKIECDDWYNPLMRFILVNKKTREFEAQRYCFRSSSRGWIELDTSTDLKKLAKKCCVRLGQDSFYDLPYLVDGFL